MKTKQLLEKLDFIKVAGTEDEIKARKIYEKELDEMGLSYTVEAFDVQASVIEKASFEVLKPYQKSYEATAYMGCVDTPEEGLVGELAQLVSDDEVSKKQVEGKIVLVSGYAGIKALKSLTKSQAFITFNGNIDIPREGNDCDTREYREPLRKYAEIPAVNIRVHDAMEIIDQQASEVRIVTKQTRTTSQSHNLICEIKGESDEIIVVTAHYDSVPFSRGNYDNTTGSICLVEMARYFSTHKPKRTLRFIWCGGEERGLLGSKAYVAAHQDELDKVVLCVNIDMIGCTIGKRIAVCTSELSLVNYLEYASKMWGEQLNCSQGVYSSDSTPFADAGVPALSFARISSPGTGGIHSRYDVIEHLSEHVMEDDIRFITRFTEEMANAYICPVPKTMPDNMVKELNKYLDKEEQK